MGHHYVPQEYLRAFQDRSKEGYVWMLVRGDNLPALLPIKNVAQSRGYYEQDVEAQLNREIEIPANGPIKKLTTGTLLSAPERRAVAAYIACMFKRVPRGREKAMAQVAPSLENTFKNLRRRAERAAVAGKMTKRQLRAIVRGLDEKRREYETELPDTARAGVLDPMPSKRITDIIADMVWRVLIAPTQEFFITSDNPAYFHEGYGLGDKRAELRFPLGPSHALHATWYAGHRGKLSFHNTHREWVRDFNRAQASKATTLLFAHEKAPWLRKLLERKQPYLYRLTWS